MKQHTVTTYTFSELSPEAQERALEQIREKLAGPWWDSADTEAVGESILYGLAEALKSPGWDTHGEGDFPGIPLLTITSWSVGDRGEHVTCTGELDPENAPALPWGGFGLGKLERGSTRVRWYDTHPYRGLSEDRLTEAWDDALATALAAGRAEMEYRTGEEYAREWLENNDVERFLEDGEME